MSEYKTDLRLPIAVFRKAPFVYVGPDFRSLPLGLLSDVVEHRGRQIQRLNPFTVSKINGVDRSTDILFCFAFFYINDDDERVVLLTQPIYLTNFVDTEALDALLVEVERFANFLGSRIIEIEVHEQLDGPVAFPTSLSFFSYNLNSMSTIKPETAHFERHEFRKEAEIVCLDQSVSEFEHSADESNRGSDEYIINSLSPLDFIAVKNKSRSFPVKSYELTYSDSVFKPINLPFFEDTAYTLQKRGWFFRKESDEGYLRWTPNIMEPFAERRTPFPLLFYHTLEEHVYSYGKIFDWGLSEEDPALFNLLLSHAVRSMKKKGIQKVQFAHVESKQKFIKKFLEKSGFKAIHRINLLSRELG